MVRASSPGLRLSVHGTPARFHKAISKFPRLQGDDLPEGRPSGEPAPILFHQDQAIAALRFRFAGQGSCRGATRAMQVPDVSYRPETLP